MNMVATPMQSPKISSMGGIGHKVRRRCLGIKDSKEGMNKAFYIGSRVAGGF